MLNPINNNKEIFIAISNKMKYGAPELNLLYQKFLTKGLIAALIIHALLISGYFFSLYLEDATAVNETELRNREIIPVDPDLPKIPEEIPDSPAKNFAFKDLASLTPEPVPQKTITEKITLKNHAELDKVDVPVSSKGVEDIADVNENAIPEKFSGKKIEKYIKKPEEKSDKNFLPTEVDKSPVASNLSQVKRSMKYPEAALRTGEEGKVVVRVLVGNDGSVIKVLGFTGPEVFRDEVTEKVVGLVFSPAIKNNQTVKCIVSVPFSFKLNSKSKEE